MEDYSETPGKTTIAPDVLTSIARLTTISVSGVSRLATRPKDLNHVFKKPEHEGVDVVVQDNRVYVDLYVILKRDVKVRDVCRAIQNHITRAISETVGMDVGKINVHVEDIDYSEA
jgi:uncharacterized alkaline shock family protein YloU